MNRKGLRILVTGGAGFIGSHIFDELVKKESGFCSEVIVLDNFIRGRRENLSWAIAHGPVTVVEGDIRDRSLLGEVMKGIDVVFHQAALRITHCADEPGLAMEVLVEGTFKLLEEAVKRQVGKVVAASSASVYGLAEKFPTSEDHHPYNNRTLYGASKSFNEAILRSFHDMYGLNYVALRYFNVYGPRMDIYGAYTEVLIRWMDQIAGGKPPVIFGDGTQTMDLVYVEDVARANLLALDSGVSDEVFNIGTGKETSLKELAQTLIQVMGSDLRPTYGPQRKVNPVPRRLADVRKARERLGFQAAVPLEEGLCRLVEWWKSEKGASE